MSLFLIRCLHRRLQVADIIQTVKNTDNIDTVRNRLLNKILHHVIRIMIIAQNILPAEEHLQLCILKSCSQLPKPLPGIFLQKPQTRIKCCAAPALYRIISHLIHLINNRKHLFRRHSGCKQRLMRVTKDGFHNLHRPFCCICHDYFLLIILINFPILQIYCQSRRFP